MNAEQKNFIEVVGAIASADMSSGKLNDSTGNFRKRLGKIRADKDR